jgi:hypothetical protein
MIAATTCLLMEGHGWVTVEDLAQLSVKPNLVAVTASGPEIYRGEYEFFDMGEHLLYRLSTAYDINILCTRPHRIGAQRGIIAMRSLVPEDELYMYDTGKLFHARPLAAPKHFRARTFDFRLKSKIQLVVARDLNSRWANTATCGMVISDSRIYCKTAKDIVPWTHQPRKRKQNT